MRKAKSNLSNLSLSAKRMRRKRAKETPEEYRSRMDREKLRNQEAKAKETPEHREERLTKARIRRAAALKGQRNKIKVLNRRKIFEEIAMRNAEPVIESTDGSEMIKCEPDLHCALQENCYDYDINNS